MLGALSIACAQGSEAPTGIQWFWAVSFNKLLSSSFSYPRSNFAHPTFEGAKATGLDLAKFFSSEYVWQPDGSICSAIDVVPDSQQPSYRLQYTTKPVPIFGTSVTVSYRSGLLLINADC
jgi:hypothetical protein